MCGVRVWAFLSIGSSVCAELYTGVYKIEVRWKAYELG